MAAVTLENPVLGDPEVEEVSTEVSWGVFNVKPNVFDTKTRPAHVGRPRMGDYISHVEDLESLAGEKHCWNTLLSLI